MCMNYKKESFESPQATVLKVNMRLLPHDLKSLAGAIVKCCRIHKVEVQCVVYVGKGPNYRTSFLRLKA